MKKRINAKDRREAAKKVYSAPKKEEPVQLAAEAEEQKTDTKKTEETFKSNAKAAGLKSTFAVDDQVVMTTFGKGNKAVVENRIKKPVITQINAQKVLDVSINDAEKKYDLTGKRNIQTKVNDPLALDRPVGLDNVGLKAPLETKYFGKTFNDNLHIQMIYNILDINKILSIHVNNVIYELNNLTRKEHSADSDLFVSMSDQNTYAVFCNPSLNSNLKPEHIRNIDNTRKQFEDYLRNPRLSYFPDAFYKPQPAKNNKDLPELELRDEKDLYYIFALLGGLRNYAVHGFSGSKSSAHKCWLFKFDDESIADPVTEECRETLRKLYGAKVRNLDDGFVENNRKTNFSIIFKALNIQNDTEKQLQAVKDFYDFVMLKNYKNMGFSVKKLREQMLLLPDASRLTDKKYDSCRGKMYRCIDFVISQYYSAHSSEADGLVDELRTALKNDNKDEIYGREASKLWSEIRSLIIIIAESCDLIVASKEKQLEIDKKSPLIKQVNAAIDEVRIAKRPVHYFSRLIYLLTLFQDGKEINDLLTTLINKLENIGSFLDVMEKVGTEYEFEPDYSLYKESWKLADELRMINSFARMGKPSPATPFPLFKDAAVLLGTNYSDEEIKDHLKLAETGKGTKHDFRNFIINNVIKSSRFSYLIRYGDPNELRKLAQNRKVVRFVLENIPETQIARYYYSCTGETCPNLEVCCSELARIISLVDFNKFEKVNNRANVADSNAEGKEKLKQQTTITLYLTVLYLITKNLVYVNSRYTLAFHCLERDAELLGSKSGYRGKGSWCDLTSAEVKKRRETIRDHFDRIENPRWRHRYDLHNKFKACDYMETNVDNADNNVRQAFRNSVDHLNAVRKAGTYINGCKKFDSYFELYHYIMQCDLSERGSYSEKVNGYLALAKENGGYSKDMVKALCAPFGYNLPRFKALSISGLFDKNTSGK